MTLVLCHKCPQEISDAAVACSACGVLEREGPFEQYYESGQLEGKYHFKNGDPRGDGLFECYNEQGELMARGFYHMSKKCGEWFAKGGGWSGRDKVMHYPPCIESLD